MQDRESAVRAFEERALRLLGAALFCARVAGKEQPSPTEAAELRRYAHLRIPSVAALAKRMRAMIGLCDLQFRRDANLEGQVGSALNVIRIARLNEQRAEAAALEHCADAAPGSVDETCTALQSLHDSDDTRRVHALVKQAAVNRLLGCRHFRQAVQSLHQKVTAHRQTQRSTQRSLGLLGDDLVAEVATHLPYRSVPALLASCKAFSKFAPLLDAMPHLSTRPIVGVVDGCAVKGRILALYTDLVLEGASGRECHELKCRRFSMLPRAEAQPLPDRLALGVRLHHDASPQPGQYRHRLGHDLFFSTPLACKAELVFADTLDPVGEPLQHCGWVELSEANCTHTCPKMDPYPARGSFRVPALSSKHGHRRFRIKVSGTARLHGPGPARTKTLHAFSEPFLVRSRLKRGGGGGRVRGLLV
jgi:hypothetical protein